MKFLIDPVSDQSISYDQFANDLGNGRVVSHSDAPFSRLYSGLVQRISEWIEVESLSDLKLTELAFEDPRRLQLWRRLFVDSNRPIQIATSGSSGQVKQVRHSMASLIRGIKLESSHRRDIWGWAYPADHLAGIQVLFQALLNHNPLVCLYQQSPNAIHQAIDRYAITHFSCTPTLLRMLLTERRVHPALLRLTSGGEKLDSNLIQSIGQMFPQARVTNIYAATETGTLLVSHDDCFSVPPDLRDKIRVREGELWLHRSLKLPDFQRNPRSQPESGPAASNQGRSPSRSDLTPENPSAEPADDLAEIDSFWATGDLVEICAEDPLAIRFVGRRHEWFNVAGFRVDPTRLEWIAASHPAIAQSRFYPIPNSITENLIGCELVLTADAGEFDPNAWKQWFGQQVQRQEIPRFVQIVDRISTTESGKVRRN